MLIHPGRAGREGYPRGFARERGSPGTGPRGLGYLLSRRDPSTAVAQANPKDEKPDDHPQHERRQNDHQRPLQQLAFHDALHEPPPLPRIATHGVFVLKQ